MTLGRSGLYLFLTQKLRVVELVWQVHDQELGVIHAAFEEWRAWLVGTYDPVLVFLDHADLQYFMKSSKLTPLQAFWAAYLSSFWFHVLHTSGKANPADPLSRRSDYEQGREAQPLIALLRLAFLNGGVSDGALHSSVSSWDIKFALPLSGAHYLLNVAYPGEDAAAVPIPVQMGLTVVS